MKFFVWIIIAINIYFGLDAFLSAIGVLQSSKYSRTATIVFALLFLGMGIGGLYVALVKHNFKTALWLGIGPWILALIFLLINMMTADYK
jgi:hypothetical protein